MKISFTGEHEQRFNAFSTLFLDLNLSVTALMEALQLKSI